MHTQSPTDAATVKAGAPSAKILVTEDEGRYDWQFSHEGSRYGGFDFATQDSALKDAQSAFRALLRGENMKWELMA